MRRAALLVLMLVSASACGRLGFDENADATPNPTIDTTTTATTPFFVDDFDRAAGTLGNGWIEKTPGIFSITDQHVTRATGGDWTVNHVSRPTAEDRADLEISVEMTVTDITGADWPQIFVRADPTDFVGYYLWVELGPTGTELRPLDLAKKPVDDTWWTALATTTVPVAANGDRFRLRLRATGANPVHLQAWYGRWTGTDWDDSITLTADDAAADAMTAPATWGFDGHTGNTNGGAGPYTYDHFTATSTAAP